MKEFKRNKETGILEVWENGKKIGEMITMGDEIEKKEDADGRVQKLRSASAKQSTVGKSKSVGSSRRHD